MKKLTESKNTANAAFEFLISKNVFSNEISQMDWVIILLDFRKKKGEDAIKALAGFYLWAIANTGTDTRIRSEADQNRALKSTFAHDLNGRDDEYMLPRSDSYIKYWGEQS